jgi:cellulose synthase (UDP-forming)
LPPAPQEPPGRSPTGTAGTNVLVMTGRDRVVAWLLLSVGIESVFYFASWWQAPWPIASPILFGLFTFAVWFSIFRMVANWCVPLCMTRPIHRSPASGLTVDVMVTAAPGEPADMIRRTLEAISRIRYPHVTYLLDDSHRDDLRALAARMNVRYIRRTHPGEGAKAGNVNHALTQSSGEFVAVFDPDHVPCPEFLDRILGHFADSSVGFVQAPQAYANQHQSIVARGAAEQTYDLYGPTMMGLHGLGTPLLFGCHTTFRRTALESIGGYAVHNAEDLRTAMRLYAKGWKGVYVPEILARGLVPATLSIYLLQQYRWAHSVFDLFFRDYWLSLRRWTPAQGLAFFLVGTYYLVGAVILINLLLPLLLLARGLPSTSVVAAAPFIVHLAPVVLINVVIRLFVQRYYLGRDERGWHFAGAVMLFASCFAHAAAFIAAAANVRVRYHVTAKAYERGKSLAVAAPYALAAGISCGLVIYSIVQDQVGADWVQVSALLNAAILASIVVIVMEERRPA